MHVGSVVEMLKPYHMLKNLFELIALEGDGDGKPLSTRACAHAYC